MYNNNNIIENMTIYMCAWTISENEQLKTGIIKQTARRRHENENFNSLQKALRASMAANENLRKSLAASTKAMASVYGNYWCQALRHDNIYAGLW